MENLLVNQVPTSTISIQQSPSYNKSDLNCSPTEHDPEEFFSDSEYSDVNVSQKFFSREGPQPKFIDALSPQFPQCSEAVSHDDSENLNDSREKQESSRIKKLQLSSFLVSGHEINGNPATSNELNPSFPNWKKGFKPVAKSAAAFFDKNLTFSKEGSISPPAHDIGLGKFTFKKTDLSSKNSPKVNIELVQTTEFKEDEEKDEEDKILEKVNRNAITRTTFKGNTQVSRRASKYKSGWFTNNIVTRAKIRAAFAQAIGNHIFNPTGKEVLLIKDKAYVSKETVAGEKERKKHGKRSLPKVKDILEKHEIIKAMKPAEIKKILKDIAKTRTFKESCIRRYYIIRKSLKKYIPFRSFSKLILLTIIHPYKLFRLTWDCISLLLILYDLILIPFQISFNIKMTGFFQAFEIFQQIFFIIDLAFNFRTGFIKDGTLVENNKEIIINYIKTWFIIDFISILTGDVMLNLFGIHDWDSGNDRANTFRLIRFVRFVRFVRVLRALRLKRLFHRIEDLFYSNVYNTIKNLVTLLFYVAFIAHLSACIWYFVADTFGEEFDDSWINDYGIRYYSTSELYIVSLCWAVTTMLTVGYGDITPKNSVERLVNIGIMIVGCGVFAYSMNKIGMMVQSMNAGSSEKRLMYYNITKYMEQTKISKTLRSKVLQYLDYMNQNEQYAKLKDGHIFSVLSESLRDEIRKDINGQVLREDVLFQKYFDSRFLGILSYKLEEKTFAPGEYIFNELDKSCSFNFIGTGTVEIYLQACDTVISQLGSGKHFGELSFFTGRPRTAAIRSLTFTHIFHITKDAFLKLVDDYPREQEIYHSIKDQMSIYDNYSVLDIECIVCGVQGHDAMSCTRVHYIPDCAQIIKHFIQREKTFCSEFKRRKRWKFHAVSDKNQIMEQAKIWAQHHPYEIQKLIANDSQISQSFLDIIKETRKEDEEGNFVISPFAFQAGSPKPTKLPKEKARQKPANSSKQKGSQSFLTDEVADDEKTPPARRNKKPTTTFLKSLSQRHTGMDHNTQIPSFPMGQNSPKSALKTDEQYRKTLESSLAGVDLQQRLDQTQIISMIEFDRVHNFTLYFPHNNVSTILEKLRIEKERMEELNKAKAAANRPRRRTNSMTPCSVKKKGKPFLGLEKAFNTLKTVKNFDLLGKKSSPNGTSKHQRKSMRPVATSHGNINMSFGAGSFAPEILSIQKLE